MTLPVIPEPAKNPPTLLVIDDEAGPRDALTAILRPFFTLLAAESASAAIDILNSRPVDIITLDQKLQDRHGLDLRSEERRVGKECVP